MLPRWWQAQVCDGSFGAHARASHPRLTKKNGRRDLPAAVAMSRAI
ncbi:hypothetical protein SSE37_19697 [Sagittula stellata E-37]|uniref:Uncharacterized protein n=1 Tax=Sagittula stellata (strain ATCC 700073 / DSM 11524 / E-37) TaxID=388399 RepID=A3JXM7_SAGS3|nr:hypothetical protein SSE37_19697 [Sagittula stellata E-37]